MGLQACGIWKKGKDLWSAMKKGLQREWKSLRYVGPEESGKKEERESS